MDASIGAFVGALKGPHSEVVERALKILSTRFTDPNPDEGYLRDGPVAVAKFDIDGPDDDPDVREQRALRQRNANAAMVRFLGGLGF